MTIRTRTLLAGVALLPIVAAALAPDARAQTAQPPRSQTQAGPAGAARDFDIAGGALDAALVAYARQANVQLLYTADLVAGLRTQGVAGRHPPEAALQRLLAGTGIRWSRSRPGVIVLRRSMNAQADPGEATEIDEVIVTGTLLRGPGRSPSPVTVISRGELDRRGDATVADALVRLPQSYSGNATPNSLLLGADSLGSNTATATGVNLRGLGADATLVLVNGRRLAGTGMKGEFADVSALPGGAVERVDVLLDGASALYGSDAVAGVVNVILRRTYEGQETRLRASAARGGGEDLLASHLVGTRWQGGSALLSYEYQHQSPLNSADRDYTATGDLTPWGGTDRRSFYGPPGSIVVFDAARGAYRSTYAIRPGPDGTARTPADFETGGANLGNRRAGVDILPLQERHSAYASVRQTLGSHVEVSADARFSRRAYEYANLAPVSILTVGRANPFFVSPTGAASHLIAYNFIGDLGPTESYGVSRSLGGTAGIEIALPRDWTLEAYGAFAEELSEGGTNNQLNSTFLSEALGNTTDNLATPYSALRDGYFNPFGSGDANGEAVLDFISQGYTWSRYRSRISSANLMLDGSPLTLPGGDLRIAVGAAFRREEFNRRSRNFASGLAPIVTIGDPQVRDIGAVFAEARIPLVGPANALPGIERLELTLAGRAEHYDDVGSTTNPKIGLIWQPSEPVTVRASWGTSFRAPALTEVFDRVQLGPLTVADSGVSRVAILQSGGNTDLEPETAESLTLGMEWAPRPGLRFSAGYFDIRFENKIGRPAIENITSILVDPSLAPFVTRLTPGNAADLARVQAFLADPRFTSPSLYPASAYSVILDGRWANTGELSVEGFDLGANFDFALGDNAFGLSVSASYLLDYSRRVTPVATREDVLGLVGFPVDLRTQAAATWTRGDWSTRIGVNHASDYRDVAGRTIDAFTTADLQVRWAGVGRGLAEGIEVALTVQNLFDADPPFYDSPQGFGFDPGQAGPLGRVAALQLIKRW